MEFFKNYEEGFNLASYAHTLEDLDCFLASLLAMTPFLVIASGSEAIQETDARGQMSEKAYSSLTSVLWHLIWFPAFAGMTLGKGSIHDEVLIYPKARTITLCETLILKYQYS